MKKLDHFLPAAVPSDEVLSAARAQRVFRDWEAIVGETLARKSWPDRYSKGVVWVAVEGSAWASELRMRKGEILTRLAERSGNAYAFKDVRFGVRKLPMRTPETDADPDLTDQGRSTQLDSGSSPAVESGELSIREIAERRLRNWNRSDG